MATQVQNRRGTTAEHSTFTGAVGEVTVDTDKDTIVVHDGTTAGGRPLLREDQSNLPTSAPTNGLYLPSANNVAISTNGTGRLFVNASGNVGVNAASPAGRLGVDGAVVIGNQLSTGTTTGTLRAVQSTSSVYLQTGLNTTTGSSADLVFSNINASNEWMRLTSAGRLGLGTSSPGYNLHVKGSSTGEIAVDSASGNDSILRFLENGTSEWSIYHPTGTGDLRFYETGSAARLTLKAGGNVGVGTTSPNEKLTLAESGATSVYQQFINNSSAKIAYIGLGASGSYALQCNSEILFNTGSGYSERARIDSSGRLLVGTSSARTNFFNSNYGGIFQVETANNETGRVSTFTAGSSGSGGPIIALGKHRSNTIGGTTLVADGDEAGLISFQGADGTEFVEAARISAAIDGTPGTNDMPGRLVFSTWGPDSTTGPTERMRITQNGFTKASNTGTYLSTTATYHEFRSDAGSGAITLNVSNSNAAGSGIQARLNSDGTTYAYFIGYSTSAAAK